MDTPTCYLILSTHLQSTDFFSRGKDSILHVPLSSRTVISSIIAFSQRVFLMAHEDEVGLTSLSSEARNALWESDNRAKFTKFASG